MARFNLYEGLWLISLANSVSTILLYILFVLEGGATVAIAIFTANSFLFWLVIGPVSLFYRVRFLKTGLN